MATEELAPELQEALSKFKEDVYDRGHEIDPDDACDWSDLAFGWALGTGYDLKMSQDISYRWVSWCHNYAL